MRAAWYEKQGPAREVLGVGEMPDPYPVAGEVRIRIAASGINPGDIKKREDAFGYGMPYPRVIPHSDGAGRVDQVGPWRFLRMDRACRVVLRSAIVSALWDRCGVYGCPT
jgi:NADPH:quinone reductase-like Zn-dependent oxidoreductase